MKILKLLKRYIKYLARAKTKYNIHSPFVYDLITEVMEDKTDYPVYSDVRELKISLFRNSNPVETIDFGAGAKAFPYSTRIRKINKIARQTEQPDKIAHLLFRIVKHFKPNTILELGTSLGISSIFLSDASPQGKITTIEGCASVASEAQNNFNKLGLRNIKVLIGNFDTILPRYLKKNDNLDFVFFDGNHRKEPTLKYFNDCLPKANENSIFVFDDIHWSEGMEEAWEAIKKNTIVTVTIDLFYMGIVFFKKDIAKQDFILKLKKFAVI